MRSPALFWLKKSTGKFLKFIKYCITQTEQHSLPNTTHHAHLNIVYNKCYNIKCQKNSGKYQHTMILLCLNICINGIANQIWTK